MSNEYTGTDELNIGLFKDVVTKSGKKYKIKKVLAIDFIQSAMPLADIVTQDEKPEVLAQKLAEAGHLSEMYQQLKLVAIAGLVSIKLTPQPTKEKGEMHVDDFFARDEAEATVIVNEILAFSGYGAIIGVEGRPDGNRFRDPESGSDLRTGDGVSPEAVTDSDDTTV